MPTDESMNIAQRSSVVTEAFRADKSGIANTYEIVSDFNNPNKNGITVEGNKVGVKFSQRNGTTGAHEVGHTLGLIHSASGLMTASSTDFNRSNDLNVVGIKDMIAYPIRRKINSEGFAKAGKGSLNFLNYSYSFDSSYYLISPKGKVRRR